MTNHWKKSHTKVALLIDIVIYALHTKAMMQTNRDKRVYLLVDITEEEKAQAKSLARSSGMTFQGWIAKIIREKLNQKEAHE